MRTFGAIFPDGDDWVLELLPRLPNLAVLRAPSGHMVTIDFSKRGLRSGYSITGRFLGEEWNKSRKKYDTSDWKQALVDDAVAYLIKGAVQ